MTTKSIFLGALALASAGFFYSCKKDPVNVLSLGNFKDTAGTLKAATSFPLGLAVDYTPMKNNPTYLGIVSREASSVTFGYQMKHGAIVQNDGSFNYTSADDLFNVCTGAGLQVYGHTLVWHQNQNASYLNGITGGASGPSIPNLLLNGGFETAGSGKPWANWSVLNNSNGTFSTGSGTANVHGGAASLQAVTTAGGNNYNTQIISDAITVTAGKTYTISYWIKAASAGSIQFEIRNNDGGATVKYVGGQPATTGFAQITYSYVPLGTQIQLAFDLGGNANTFLIDDISIIDAAAASAASPGAITGRVDSVMNRWITNVVTHYAGKVKAWDVVNEPMSDGGALRASSNTTAAAGATDFFLWQQYLGRDYAVKAFKYAKAADPNALLFINDYNLEYSSVKIDSLLAYVAEIKAKGAPVDGIGTQMHINILSSYALIDAAFQKLAATGLKVRVSELDVRINPSDKTGFSAQPLDPVLLAYQADMYKYVVSSYMKYVPAAQRYGITVWGVDDPESWIITSQKKADNPLLFDAGFKKKLAYSGFLQGLKGK
jgi:endo-1,4-beta-xylanase